MEQPLINRMSIDKKIYKLSNNYNYYGEKKAIKILSNMSLDEAFIVLSSPKVQKTIFSMEDVDVLKEIFRKSPAFFQEIMFLNEKIQDLLISPKKSLTRKELITNYNNKDFFFNEKEIRTLEVFFNTVKSPKIYEQIVENKFFQRIVPLFYEHQIGKSLFKNIDIVKLFYNIINDEEIYNTRRPRQRNIIEIFNKVSNHILLPDNYQTIIGDGMSFIISKYYKFKEERIYIDDRTLDLLTYPMLKELLDFENIDDEYIKNYLKKDILSKIDKNNYDFSKIFSHFFTDRHYYFSGLDYIYFCIIIEKIDNNEELKEKFINFVYNILCNDQNFNLTEEDMIKKALYNKMKNMEITKEEYKNLFCSPCGLKTIFYLKFGKLSSGMDYLNGISSKQLFYLNIKHINQILNSLGIENEDELSNLYSFSIKLYMVFGLERTLKILKGDYGYINRYFFDNVSNLNVNNVSLIKEGKKFIPKLSNNFINFMFSNENENHFKNMLLDSSSLLSKNWSYLYNNYEEIKEKCHGLITLKKLNIIFKELSPERELDNVSPNNYKLQENDILNDVCLGNKTRKTNEEVYKTLLDIYEKMKHRIESSIPYVQGNASNGYSYEMMKLNDPIVFTLGYKGNCCIRVNDIAHNHLLHATLCRNGRILLIFDKLHQLAGFVPLKRNGEVLIANSIECLHKIRNESAIFAFEAAVKDIVETSKNNEKDPINLVCIGNEAYAKPKGDPFPNDIKTPTIYEKKDFLYGTTDQYHRKLDIIYKNPSLNLSNIKYGNPQCSYVDPRPKVNSCDFRIRNKKSIEQALKIINAVRYENAEIEELENFDLCTGYDLDKCIYSEDWYIVTTYDGNIYGDYLNFNPKAEIEYKFAFGELVGMNYDDYVKINGKEKKIVLQRSRY